MIRTLLLEREGCIVVSASEVPELRARLLGHSFDLVLICQSITAEESESAVEFAREHAPSARLLAMFTSVDKCIPGQADVILDAHAGPEAFIETVKRMLSSVGRSL